MLCLLPPAPGFAHGSCVYVSNYGDGTISQFRANPNGTLTPLDPPSVKAYPRCHSMAADPKGRFLYVASALEFSRRNCRISQFRIRPNGSLAPMTPPTVLVPYSGEGGGPSLVTADPLGRYVYVIGRDGSVTQFRCRKDGSLHLASRSSVGGLVYGGHYSASYDQKHTLLFVLGYGRSMDMVGGVVGTFRRQGASLGALPLAYGGSDWDTPLAFALAQHGRVAYVLHGTYSMAEKTVRLVIDQRMTRPNGRLVPLNPPHKSLPADAVAEKMLVDPGSRHCYLINGYVYTNGERSALKGLRLSRYVILKNGTLGRLTRQTLPVSDGVLDAAFTPSGRFLYLLTDDSVRPMRVRRNGSVVPVTPRSIRAGRGPLGLVYVRR